MDHVIVIGTSVASSRAAIEIAERYPGWVATVGLHPQDAGQWTETTNHELRAIAAHPCVVAIGETGLDFHYRNHSPEVQMQAFVAQCELASELELPVVIHSRESLSEVRDVLERHMHAGGVMHSFTGPPNLMYGFLDLGMFVSFSGIVTFRNADDVRASAAVVPLDRILAETDSPYLSPVPVRGRRNEPAHVVHTVTELAHTRAMPVPSLVSAIAANARTCFGANGFSDPT